MPTYGRVKVDTITYDLSGTATDVSVSNIATKASPTFTGTVTVPTASANDNTTKAASTAYVQTELGDYALKAGPTFTGTINAASLVLSADLTVNGTTTTINTTTLQVEDKNIEIGKVSSPSDATADGGGLTLLGATNKTWNWVNSTDAWTSSEHINVPDNKKLLVGTGSDLEIFHDGNHSRIYNSTGNLSFKSAAYIFNNAAGNENLATFTENASVELYHNNVKTFETEGSGIKVLGPEGGSAFVYMHADEGDDNADKYHLQVDQDGTGFYIKNEVSGSTETNLRAVGNGAVELYFDNSKKIETTSGGINVTGAINVNGSALSAAPEIEATANGSITANEAIIVESDGKVAGVTGVSASLGTEQEYFNARVRQHMCAFDSTTGKTVHAYANDGNQNQLYARVGTVSGNSISYGSAVTVSSGDSDLTFEYGCSMACGNGKVVVILADSSGGGNIKARAGTISGTSISFGSAVTLQTGGTNSSTDICYDSDKDKFIVLYANNDTGNAVESVIITLSGTTISTADAFRTISSAGDDCSFINVIYVPEKTSYFAVFTKGIGEDPRSSPSGAGLPQGVVGTINSSGNQLTWGSTYTLGGDSKNNLSIVYVPSIEKVAMAYLDRYQAYRLESLVITVNWSNKTLSIGNYSVIESSGSSSFQPIIACLSDNEPKILVAYQHSPGLVNNIGTINNSNNTIAYAGRQTVDSGGDIRVGSAWGKGVYPKIASGKFLLSAVDYSASKTWSLIQQFAATDLTSENFIGFAAAGYSNGDTATVKVTGNTTTGSSLTAGKKYFVQQDGTIALTADTPSVEAGIALSSTKLLIKG